MTSVSMLLLLASGALQVCLFAGPASSRPGDRSQKPPATRTKSLTGCIDEGGAGRYALLDPVTLARVADLEADGFPNEGFAKYLGNKVTVKGSESGGGSGTAFKVRSIERVSETCSPPASSK